MQTLVTKIPKTIEETEVEQDKSFEETKRCPYCAEIILAAAIKCRHCGEFLNKSVTPPPPPSTGNRWYQSNTTIVLALLTMGPLALPMVWVNKRYSSITKTVITVLVLGATFVLCYGAYKSLSYILDLYKQIGLGGIS